jgi:hypothetical protein
MGFNKDEKGIGGFTESLLAIMIVTVAVVLFTITMSVNLAGSGDKDLSKDVQTGCRVLVDRIVHQCSSVDGTALSRSGLEQTVLRPFPVPETANGYLVVVKDLSLDQEVMNMGQGPTPEEGAPVEYVKVPVNIELNDGRLHVGLLEVSCW